MTPIVIGGAQSSSSVGLSKLPGPISPNLGIPTTLPYLRLPAFLPNRVPISDVSVTRMRPNPRDIDTIVREGGTDYGNRLNFGDPSVTRAALSAGPWGRNAVLAQSPQGVLTYAIMGEIDTNGFTLFLWVDPVTADWTQIASANYALRILGPSTNLELAVQKVETSAGATATIRAQMLNDRRGFRIPGGTIGGSVNEIHADMAIATGDYPSGSFTLLVMSWDKATGILRIHNKDNTKSGASSAAPNPSWLLPWHLEPKVSGGGLIIGTNAQSGFTAPMKVADLHVQGRGRQYNTMLNTQADGLVIDANSAGSTTWNPRINGVILSRPTGIYLDVVGEETPYVALDDAEITAALKAGVTHCRFAEWDARITVTLNGSNVVTDVDCTALFSYLDRFISSANGGGRTDGLGLTSCDWMLGYTPTNLGGSTNRHTVPNIAGDTAAGATQFAKVCSIIHTKAKAKYGTTFWKNFIRYIALWNEPSQGSAVWRDPSGTAGTTTQMVALHTAVRTLHATDHPDMVPIGTCNESWDATDSSTSGGRAFQSTIIDDAKANGYQLGAVFQHAYGPHSLTTHAQNMWAQKNYLTLTGFSTQPLQVVGECGMHEASIVGGGGSIGPVLSIEPISRVESAWYAAYMYRFMYDRWVEGVDACEFFRLGQIANAFMGTTPSSEDMHGLFNNQGRPRPVFAAYEALGYHKATDKVLTCVSNSDQIRGVATISSDNKRITVSYGMFAGFRPDDERAFYLAWPNLVSKLGSSFTWEQRVMDHRYHADNGRLVLAGAGDQTNFVDRVQTTGWGVGVIQITAP